MNLSPLPIQKFFDNNGRPLVGGLLFTYIAGTSTKIATYKDESGGPTNTNPVVLDYRGEANVWLDQQLTYKFVLAPEGDTDPPTKPIWTVDKVSAAVTYASLTRQIVGQILWPRTAAEIAAGVTPVDYSYRTEPYDMRRYGVAFDSNGTSGNGTDNTSFIINAIKVAKQRGDKLTAPAGRARYTAPITEFTSLTLSTNPAIHGDSKYSTRFFADFTPATRRAGFEIDNPTGNRMYWSFKNFTMEGPAGNFGVAIYSKYGHFLSEFENLFLLNGHDGLVLAFNYEQSLVNIDAVCRNNGIQIGYELDNVTQGRCNNISIRGGDTTLCGANGLYVFGALNISAHGSSSEGNVSTNYYFDTCEGVVLSGVYVETDPSIGGVQTAQVYCVGCTGVVINGMTVSGFKHGGEPIYYIDNCAGVTFNGIAIRSSGGPHNAIGLKIKSSTGVAINSSSISDCATSIQLDAASASELTINNTRLLNYTNSVVGSGAVAHKIQWNQAIAGDVSFSSFDPLNIVDIVYTNNTKNQIENTETFYASVTFTELNAGGKILIDAILPSERWRIIDILAYVETPFTPAGGDRNVQILDAVAVIVYTTITAATLKAAASVNRWGSAAVPIPVNSDSYTPTGAQHDLRVQYQGGTTNYTTAGVLQLTITAMRTA